MSARWPDWFTQAEHDLKAAHDSRAAGNFEWACFQSQQAADLALKALLRARALERVGHSVEALLREVCTPGLPDPGPLADGRELDRHYIPTRYPNGLPAGFPASNYDVPTANRAIEAAARILEFVRGQLPPPPAP